METDTQTPCSLPSLHELGRVILFGDIDCFETQVWKNEKGVVQENLPVLVVDHSDIMLSINYEARALGIPKAVEWVNVDKLQDRYPELEIIRTDLKRGLTDNLLLQRESDKMLDAMISCVFLEMFKQGNMVLERRNNDEVYIDCTEIVQKLLAVPPSAQCGMTKAGENETGCKVCLKCGVDTLTMTANMYDPTIVLEHSKKISSRTDLKSIAGSYRFSSCKEHVQNAMLMYGAAFARGFQFLIRKKTGYQVSFGIAQNKMQAKIACEANKPNGITMLTNKGCRRLLQTLEFQQLPGYRSNTGEKVRDLAQERFGLDLVTVEDVRKCGKKELQRIFQIMGHRYPKKVTTSLRQKTYGICNDPVISKRYSRFIRKSLPLQGKNSVKNWELLRQRIEDLASVFKDHLEYHFSRYGQTAVMISVKTKVKRRRHKKRKTNNVMKALYDPCGLLPTEKELKELIEYYVKAAHGRYFQDISRIWITASKFVAASIKMKDSQKGQ